MLDSKHRFLVEHGITRVTTQCAKDYKGMTAEGREKLTFVDKLVT
jgi:hypothetical protein